MSEAAAALAVQERFADVSLGPAKPVAVAVVELALHGIVMIHDCPIALTLTPTVGDASKIYLRMSLSSAMPALLPRASDGMVGFYAGSMPNRRFVSAAFGAFRKAIRARASSTRAVARADSDREGRDRLERRRDEADDRDSGLVEEFAELLNADLGLATGHQRGHGNAGLGLDEARRFARRIEPPAPRDFEQMSSARPGRIADRAGGGECGPDRLARRRCPGAGAPARTASAIDERTNPTVLPGRRRPSAPSLIMTSAASATTSNGSPARTRLAASTPPTASIATRLPVSCSYGCVSSASTRRVAIEEMPVIGCAMDVLLAGGGFVAAV